MTTLYTADEVMDMLGGTNAVAALTKRKPTAASNWRKFGRFPANTYLVMRDALAEDGFDAPASLWGMVE